MVKAKIGRMLRDSRNVKRTGRVCGRTQVPALLIVLIFGQLVLRVDFPSRVQPSGFQQGFDWRCVELGKEQGETVIVVNDSPVFYAIAAFGLTAQL